MHAEASAPSLWIGVVQTEVNLSNEFPNSSLFETHARFKNSNGRNYDVRQETGVSSNETSIIVLLIVMTEGEIGTGEIVLSQVVNVPEIGTIEPEIRLLKINSPE